MVHWPKRSACEMPHSEPALVPRGGDRGADHHAVEAQVPGQRLGREAADALAHQRAPGDGGRDRGEHGVARRPAVEPSRKSQEDRFARRASRTACKHGLRVRSSASSARAMKSARVASSTLMPRSRSRRRWPSFRPEPANRSISARVQASARSTRFGPTIAAAAAITVLGELPAARAASAATSIGSPTRLTSAATAMSSIARSFGPATLVHQRQREVGLQRLQREIEHGVAVHAR